MEIKDPYKIARMIISNEQYVFCFYDFNGRPINKIRTNEEGALKYMEENLFNYTFELYKVGFPSQDIDIFCYKKKKIDINELLEVGKSFKEINKILKQWEESK